MRRSWWAPTPPSRCSRRRWLKKEIALYGENFEREEPSDPGIAKLLFLCQPMQELDMYGTLDAAVCALDSLNHCHRPAGAAAQAFGRVSAVFGAGRGVCL